MEGPVKDFFISQSYYEKNKVWPFGDWPHSYDGKFTFYSQKLNIKDPILLLDFLRMIASDNFIAGHELCICASYKTFRKCHQKVLFELKNKIPKNLLSDFSKKSDILDKRIVAYKIIKEAIKATLAKKDKNGFSASN